MKLQIDIPLACSVEFHMRLIKLAAGKKIMYGEDCPVGVQFFLNETQAREYTGQPTAGKKDEKGNIIQRGAVAAQGGSGFSIEKLLKVAEESGKAKSASVRADLMAHDKLVNEKIEKIAVAQQ
eukprot:2742760-Prymnesium_polylepis.1